MQRHDGVGDAGVAGDDAGESLDTSSALLLSALSAIGLGESGVVAAAGVRELSSLLLSKTFLAASLHVGIGGILRVGVGVTVGLVTGGDSFALLLILSGVASVVVVSH